MSVIENLTTEQSAEILGVISLELSQISESLKAKTGLSRETFLTLLGKDSEKVVDTEFIGLAKKVGIEKMPTGIFKKRFLNVKVSNLSGEVPRLKKGLQYIAIHFDNLSNNLVLESLCTTHKVNIGLGKELVSSAEKLDQLFGKHWADARPAEKGNLTKLRNANFDKQTKDTLLERYGNNLPKVIENRQIATAIKRGNFKERRVELISKVAGELGYDIVPKILVGNEESVGRVEVVKGFNPEIHDPEMESIQVQTEMEPLDSVVLISETVQEQTAKRKAQSAK